MKIFKNSKLVIIGFAVFLMSMTFVPTTSSAASAEYKCTNKCTFCVTVEKKVICSEKYSEDSDEFEKGRQLKKYVNDGLINPDDKLKQGFSLDNFSKKYFNCELMIKKVEQIEDATQKMCVAKIVRYESTSSQKRVPASRPAPTPKSSPKKTKYSN